MCYGGVVIPPSHTTSSGRTVSTEIKETNQDRQRKQRPIERNVGEDIIG